MADTVLYFDKPLSWIDAARVMSFEVTTDANGEWSVDYSGASLTGAPVVFAQVAQDTATASDMCWSGPVKSRTATAASGVVLRGAELDGPGSSVRRAPAGITVMVWIFGPGGGV